MANILVERNSLSDIADSIRAKNGTQTTYKPSEMSVAIDALPSGGITPTGELEITANGTYNVTNYASAEVDVPQSGITPTGTISITQNGTTDVTNYASASVNVQGSGGYTPDEIGGVVYVSGTEGYYNTDISGAIDITVFATRPWAFTETAITSAVVRTTGNVSGYSLRERTFSVAKKLTDLLYMPGAANHGIGAYAAQNCPSLTRVRITGTINNIIANAFSSCPNLTDIYVPWAEGAVANAPWGATNATVHYNTVFDSDGNIVE